MSPTTSTSSQYSQYSPVSQYSQPSSWDSRDADYEPQSRRSSVNDPRNPPYVLFLSPPPPQPIPNPFIPTQPN